VVQSLDIASYDVYSTRCKLDKFATERSDKKIDVAYRFLNPETNILETVPISGPPGQLLWRKGTYGQPYIHVVS
jgi:hypothetical protein